jgi:hypothetical protein
VVNVYSLSIGLLIEWGGMFGIEAAEALLLLVKEKIYVAGRTVTMFFD